MELDCVRIGVDDLVAETRRYETLLGAGALPTGDGGVRFRLRRGAIELGLGEPGIQSLGFVRGDDTETEWPGNGDAFHGLRVGVHPRRSESSPAATAPGAVDAIDHVVVNSPDLERAIALWRDHLGLRLALDREFPKRGLRLLFFRSGGITLEFAGTVGAPSESPGPDRFYGMAYRVADLPACRARLRAADVDVSEIRDGQKRGTAVATVRSGTAGVPTLLIAEGDATRVASAESARGRGRD